MAAFAAPDAGAVAGRPVRGGLRVAAVVACSGLAYSYSLSSVFAAWHYQTPLADLALVPVLAGLLLVGTYRRYPHVEWLRLSRVDVVLAVLFVVAALAVLLVGPVVWSKYFWAARLDLLTLPLFVAAAVLLLFGTRALVRFGAPLAFLALVWPLPYNAVLERTLGGFTHATAWAAAQIAVFLGLAEADPSSSGVFLVEHGGHRVTVQVASACSGVNALVGFTVVGVFALYFVKGAAVRRLAWLLLGLLLVWAFNVLRIVGILAVAGRWGEEAAFRVLHPAAGLIALNAAALVLVGLMRPFGLRWRREQVEVDSPLAAEAEPQHRATGARFLRRLALLAAATVAMALANGSLKEISAGLSNDGRPAVAPFTAAPSVGPRWESQRLETIGWATPYYGRHSSWVRYRLRPAAPGAPPFTVWLDAVRSPDLGALNAYTLAHCYDFHDFQVDLARRVDLGGGVVGQAFVYDTPRARWHAVSWQWPVLVGNGDVEHERIVLLASTESRPATHDAGTGGVRGFLLSLFNLRAPDRDDNPALTRALEGVAADAVRERIRRAA